MSTHEEPALEFIQAALARPAGDVMAALIDAAIASKQEPRDQRLQGVVLAGRWLGQSWDFGPVSGESYFPAPGPVAYELELARRVAADEDARPDPLSDMTSTFAQGVVDMLTYATDPSAQPPVPPGPGSSV